LKKNSISQTTSGQKTKPAKARGPVQRDSKEVMAELVAKLSERLGPKPAPEKAAEGKPGVVPAPNRDRLTVGVDLGDQWSNYCILGLEGETLAEGQLRTTGEDVAAFFRALSAARVILEVGTHSAWVREVVVGCGHEVLVANPRLMDGTKRRKSTEVRQDLVVLRARDALVTARTQLINTTRGLVKSMGARLPKCSSPSFSDKVEETLPAEVREALLPLVRLAEALSDCIKVYDERIEKLGREKYGHTELLQQVKGVGPLTSLAYVLTLENPDRFRKSRDVGPYLGLVPKQEDSGDSQPQLRISKAGDVMVRRLLVGSAHYILGRFGPDTDLRRYGLRLCERGGKNAKKRAAVAVARKLAVLLHRLWISGEVYEPLRHGAPTAEVGEAA